MRGAAIGVLLALAVATPASAQTIELGDPVGCLEAVPAALTPPPFAEPVDVRVLVLLDGVTEAVADAAMQSAAAAYLPLALRVKVAEFRPVSLKTDDARGLIDESRAAVGGGRPAGADLVYTFTGKNMTGGVYGDGVAGMADCIGGVAFADTAFAVGEADDSQDLIAAHELGHLLGAHHHYANCAEAICTIMINDVGLASMEFSSLNGSVVRGHAEAYLPGDPFPGAKPVSGGEPDPEPEPQPQPPPSQPPSQQPAPAPPPSSQPAQSPPMQADSGAERAGRCRAARRKLNAARRRLSATRRSKARRVVVRRRAAAVRRADRVARRACN